MGVRASSGSRSIPTYGRIQSCPMGIVRHRQIEEGAGSKVDTFVDDAEDEDGGRADAAERAFTSAGNAKRT